MNVKVVWDTPDQKILRLVFQPRWTRDGLNQALEVAWHTLEKLDHKSHIVVDQTGGNVPASVFLTQAKLLSTLAEHPQAGSLIVIGADEETRALCEMVSYRNTLCEHFHFADTLEDAYSLLSQLDFVAGLNDLFNSGYAALS
jgi:altronate dehydratase